MPERNRAVNRALGNGVSAKFAVLSVPPGAFCVIEPLDADTILKNAFAIRFAVRQNIHVALIVINSIQSGIIHGSIAYFRFVQIKVVMEKEPDFAGFRMQISYSHFFNINIVPLMNAVFNPKLHLQPLIYCDTIGD